MKYSKRSRTCTLRVLASNSPTVSRYFKSHVTFKKNTLSFSVGGGLAQEGGSSRQRQNTFNVMRSKINFRICIALMTLKFCKQFYSRNNISVLTYFFLFQSINSVNKLAVAGSKRRREAKKVEVQIVAEVSVLLNSLCTGLRKKVRSITTTVGSRSEIELTSIQ